MILVTRHNSAHTYARCCTLCTWFDEIDPCHGVDCTTTQIFGNGPRTANPPPMNGFAQDSNRHLKEYARTQFYSLVR